MAKIKAKKSLGQHFLIDDNIARNITNSLSISPTNNVLEVGPGMGVLTKYLKDINKINLKLIEIDKESITFLKSEYPEISGNIIQDDFLKADLKNLFVGEYSIIGNFPYNISSQILFKVLENKDKIDEVVGMLQKEVAERICAKPGSKVYGILSVLLQAYFDVEYLFTVPETVFKPPPKVKSGVIRLVNRNIQNLGCSPKLFKTIVKTGFNQRRKMLRNSLGSFIKKENDLPELFKMRPEQISVAGFIELTNYLEKFR